MNYTKGSFSLGNKECKKSMKIKSIKNKCIVSRGCRKDFKFMNKMFIRVITSIGARANICK
jgi:hypothetical protein